MIKPILKIELPERTTAQEMKEHQESLQNTSLKEDYHPLLVRGKSEFVHIEIITASDISLHK